MEIMLGTQNERLFCRSNILKCTSSRLSRLHYLSPSLSRSLPFTVAKLSVPLNPVCCAALVQSSAELLIYIQATVAVLCALLISEISQLFLCLKKSQHTFQRTSLIYYMSQPRNRSIFLFVQLNLRYMCIHYDYWYFFSSIFIFIFCIFILFICLLLRAWQIVPTYRLG